MDERSASVITAEANIETRAAGREDPEVLGERKLVLLPVLVGDLAPVTADVPREVAVGELAGSLEGHERYPMSG